MIWNVCEEVTTVDAQWRVYQPYRSPFDPCPASEDKAFMVPPNQYITFQKKSLKQYAPREALKRGTLWPDLYSPYERPRKKGGAR